MTKQQLKQLVQEAYREVMNEFTLDTDDSTSGGQLTNSDKTATLIAEKDFNSISDKIKIDEKIFLDTKFGASAPSKPEDFWSSMQSQDKWLDSSLKFQEKPLFSLNPLNSDNWQKNFKVACYRLNPKLDDHEYIAVIRKKYDNAKEAVGTIVGNLKKINLPDPNSPPKLFTMFHSEEKPLYITFIVPVKYENNICNIEKWGYGTSNDCYLSKSKKVQIVKLQNAETIDKALKEIGYRKV